ncbi:MAG TPA: UvrB/UvrC motif-containing protein, partial [Gemmatimonadaceae bacterium]|nr:UvrB/UvrC motif-containing protein [Gemmatimonadaceae bacterium]
QEGFLRSDRSLIQTVGRAARNLSGRAIFYADKMTGSMVRCIEETNRRREIQTAYNVEHGITPISVKKSVEQVRFTTRVADSRTERDEREKEKLRRVAESGSHYGMDNLPALIADLESQMREAATNLDFETAARLRDELFEVKAKAGRKESGRGSLAGRHGR